MAKTGCKYQRLDVEEVSKAKARETKVVVKAAAREATKRRKFEMLKKQVLGARSHVGGASFCTRCGTPVAKFHAASCPGTPFERAVEASRLIREKGEREHRVIAYTCAGEPGVLCGVCGYHGNRLLRALAEPCLGKAVSKGVNNLNAFAKGRHPRKKTSLGLDWATFRDLTGKARK